MARAVAILALAGLVAGFAAGDLERGNRHYRAGRYAEAADAYRSALDRGRDSPRIRYNLGTALMRLGRYDEAEEHLRAALGSVDPGLRPRALYNLGTSYLEAGRASDDAELRETLLDSAVVALKHALRLTPADHDAKWNLEMALRERDAPPPPADGGGSGRDGGDPDDADADGAGAEPPPGETATPPPRGGHAPLTPEEAERILNAVEQDERDVYRQQLRDSRRDVRVERDW